MAADRWADLSSASRVRCDSGSFPGELPPVSLLRPRERRAARGQVLWVEAWAPGEAGGAELRSLSPPGALGSAKLPPAGAGRGHSAGGGQTPRWGRELAQSFPRQAPRISPTAAPPLPGRERRSPCLLNS